MTEQMEYRKINCSLLWSPDLDFYWTPSGIKVNHEFDARLSDYNKYFNDLLLDKIDNSIGKDGWAIYFKQVSAEKSLFYGLIYLDNPNLYDTAMKICIDNIAKEINVEYIFKGDIATFLAPYQIPH